MKTLIRFIITALALSTPLAYATCELRADTAATITAGMFVDATDGVTTEEALTLVVAEVFLSKNGGALAAKNDAGNPAHLNAGVYDIDLDATDTNTEGTLDIYIEDNTTAALRVWRHCMVLGADFYDLKYGTTTPITTRDVGLLFSGTISTVTSQTVLVMSGGATDDDNYNDALACIVGGTEEGCRAITDYVGSTNTITLESAMPFTVATSDVVRIHRPNYVKNIGTLQTLDELDTAQDTAHSTTQASVNQIKKTLAPVETTIATLASQVSFTLTNASPDDDAYNGCMAMITDSGTTDQIAYAGIQDYTGSTKTVTLDADPGIFTMAVSDTVTISCLAVTTEFMNKSEVLGTGGSADKWRGN